MDRMRGMLMYWMWGLSLLLLPLTGTPDLSAQAPGHSDTLISGSMGGRSGGGRSGGGRSGGGRGGGHSGGHGGGMRHGGGRSGGHGGGMHTPHMPGHTPTHIHHPPRTRYIPQYTPPPVIYSQPSTPSYPPSYEPPSYAPPVYTPEPTPPPIYVAPPEEPQEEPTPQTITIVIYINDVPIPVDVPIDVIDDGTVIEVPSDDGTVIYVVPCNEASAPGDSPTGGTGYWQWIPPSAGQICGYWVWIPTDEAGTPTTIIDVYPPGFEPEPETTIIDVFPPEPETTIIDVFPPTAETPAVTALQDIVVIVLGDGTIIEVDVPGDVIVDGTIIDVLLANGYIIYIIPNNEDNPPLVGPIDGLGYWQWIPGYEGFLGYWLWIPVDDYGNPVQQIIDVFAPQVGAGVVTVTGSTLVLPNGEVIVVTGGDGYPAVVTITYVDGTSKTITVPVVALSSVVTVPLSTGVNVELLVIPQGSPPTAAPADSPYGQWQWIAPTSVSKGYWMWVPDVKKQPRKFDMTQRQKGHLEKVAPKAGQKSKAHMKWVPGKGDQQKQKVDQRKPGMDKQKQTMTQQKKPVVDKKQKMKGRTDLMRGGKVDQKKTSKGHLKWVPSGQSGQQQQKSTK